MKKISKFLLFVVTLISLVFLIFYKLQYDKLYNVLEVLEFYGNPDAADKSAGLQANLITSSLWRPPSWKQTFGPQKVMIYSAFCSKSFDSDDPCPIVKLVAIAPKNFDKALVNCELWYEDTLRPMFGMFFAEPLIVPEVHSASQEVETPPSNMTGFVFSCESKYTALLPFGVSINVGDPKESLFVPVEQHREKSLDVKTPDSPIRACIIPQVQRTDSTMMMLENVLLHRLFGIETFHIYDAGVTYKFLENLKNLERPTVVKILPWNLGEGIISRELLKLLVQTDCHYRGRAEGGSVIVLEVSQILTPVGGTIQAALNKNGLTGKLDFGVLKLCPELQPAQQTWDGPNLLTLQQTVFSKKLSSVRTISMTHKLDAHSSVVKVPRNLISVRDYESCPDQLDQDSSDLEKDDAVKLFSHAIVKEVGKFFPFKSTLHQ